MINNLINVEDNNITNYLGKKKYPEVIVDYSSNPYGKIMININNLNILIEYRIFYLFGKVKK